MDVEPPRGRSGSDGQVGPGARIREVCQRCACADLTHVVEGDRADAGGPWRIRVRALREPGRETCLRERGLRRKPRIPRVTPHTRGAVLSVPFIVEVKVCFDRLEVRQHPIERPLVVPPRGPSIKVLGNAADEDLVVDRAAAADQLSARERGRLLAGRRLGRVAPEMLLVTQERGGARADPDVRRQRVERRIVGSGLEEKDGPGRVFGEARRDDRACRTRPDHFDIELLRQVSSRAGRTRTARQRRSATPWSRIIRSSLRACTPDCAGCRRSRRPRCRRRSPRSDR